MHPPVAWRWRSSGSSVRRSASDEKSALVIGVTIATVIGIVIVIVTATVIDARVKREGRSKIWPGATSRTQWRR